MSAERDWNKHRVAFKADTDRRDGHDDLAFASVRIREADNMLQQGRLLDVLDHPQYVEADGDDLYRHALAWLRENTTRSLTLRMMEVIATQERKLAAGISVVGIVYECRRRMVPRADFLDDPTLLPKRPPPSSRGGE